MIIIQSHDILSVWFKVIIQSPPVIQLAPLGHLGLVMHAPNIMVPHGKWPFALMPTYKK